MTIRISCLGQALVYAFCLTLPLAASGAEGQPGDEAGKAELVLELDPYYSDVGYNIPLTSQPIPTITSDNELAIYSQLVKDSLLPRYMVLEASVYPLAALGTHLNMHAPSVYRQAKIGNSGVNIFESATVGFQEPWAISAFFGNVAKLQRPGESNADNNYGYTGYLFSGGAKHIKDNTLIDDKWFEFEWKIKGKLDSENDKLSWSFRVGGKWNSNRNVNDIGYIGLHRSNLDMRYSFLQWLENTSYDLRLHFLQHGGQMVRAELIAGRKFPDPAWKVVPALEIGFVWTRPQEYSGALLDQRRNRTTLLLRPSIAF